MWSQEQILALGFLVGWLASLWLVDRLETIDKVVYFMISGVSLVIIFYGLFLER